MHAYSKKIEGGGLLGDIAGAVVNKSKDIVGTVVNKSIDLLPVELHLPGYQYCGPGTKLTQRLRRGDPGINKLDAACKDHDIAYSKYSDSSNRAKADRILAERAWERAKSNDASFSERLAAYAVTGVMNTKSKLGRGIKKRKRRSKKSTLSKIKSTLLRCTKRGKGLYLRPYKRATGDGLKKKGRRKK